MLPGQGQTETQLIATPFLRALADETGSIFAVLSPHVTDSISAAGGADVYSALDALQTSLRVDRRRLYLAGYSAGAFGAFMIVPERPQTWTAMLSIAGTLTNQDKTGVVTAMAGKQVFMVVGSDDAEVNSSYVRAAIAYLKGNGVEARYDEQPHGTHSLQTLQPAVERAWRAMLSDVRNVAPTFDVPSPEPTRTIHM
jgi:predicted peptidase